MQVKGTGNDFQTEYATRVFKVAKNANEGTLTNPSATLPVTGNYVQFEQLVGPKEKDDG